MAETIRDFIVSLGFKVEKGEEARLNASLLGLAKTVGGIAAALTAAAGTITAAVVSVASSFDKLYYVSQRTGASVASIKSLSYALSQFGGSGEQAAAAYEGLAQALRTNPGAEGLLNSLGVVTRQKGALRDIDDLLDGIVKNVGSKYDYSVQTMIAPLLGINDEKSWNTFVKFWPQIQAARKEYRDEARGFGYDPDKAAESGNRLMTSIRSLLMTVEILSDKILTDLQPKLTEYLRQLQEWFRTHQDDIVQAIQQIMAGIKGVTEDIGRLGKAIQPVTDGFLALAKAISGEENSVKVALEAVMLFMTGRWLVAITGALGKVALVAMAALWALNKLGVFSPGLAPLGAPTNEAPGATGPGGRAGSWVDENGKLHISPTPGEQGKAPSESLWSKYGWGGSYWKSGKTSASGKSAGLSAPDVDPMLMAAINSAAADSPYGVRMKSGYRPGDPRYHGMGFAADVELFDKQTGKALPNYQDPNSAAAYKEFADQVRAQYEATHPGKGGDLRWGGYFWNGGKGNYGALDLMHFDVGGRGGAPMGGGSWEHGFSPQQQKEWGINAAGKVSLLDSAAPLMGSAARTATLNNKTDITIIGSNDPASTASAMGRSQDRVWSELTRNAQSAFS